MKAKKLLPWICGILGVILLGAIANGVWSGILSPALNWLVDITIRSLSFISVTFKNGIYVDAAKGFHEAISCRILTLLWLLMLGVPVVSLIMLYRLKRLSSQPSKERAIPFAATKHGYVVLCIAVLIMAAITCSDIIEIIFINKVTTQSLNSIDIIAPFIEQKEYLSLKSDFLRIKNAEDYEDFHRKMVELSDKHEIELPLFKPL